MKKYLVAAVVSLALLPLPTSANPYSDLTAVVKALGSVKSFEAVEDHGAGMKSTIVFVSPDRWQINNGRSQELIIGNDMYMKMLGHWRKVGGAINGAGMTSLIKNPLGSGPITSVIQISSEKRGVLNGIPVRIFRYTRRDTPGVHATLSVSAKSNLPLKDVVVAPHSTTVVTYSKYNAKFSIVAPSI